MCDDDSTQDDDLNLVLIGIGLSVVGSTASNLGVNIQKFSFNQEAKKPKSLQRPYVKQCKWWIGIVLVILGAIMDFVAFGFAPASVVTPVGSFTLVSNIFFAHCWLGESLGVRDFVGTGLIFIGATVAVAFGDHSSTCYTTSDLKRLWERTPVHFYLGAVVASVIVMYLVVRKAQALLTDALVEKETKAIAAEAVAASVGNGRPVAPSSATNPDVPLPVSYESYKRWHPLCYAGLAGVLGAQTVLFAKAVAEMLKTTFDGDSQFDQPLTFITIACMFFTIFSQQHWLATGLQYFDALYIVPVFQAWFIGVSVIAGGIYFREFAGFDTQQWVLFPSGVLLCLVGVLVLSDRDMTTPASSPTAAAKTSQPKTTDREEQSAMSVLPTSTPPATPIGSIGADTGTDTEGRRRSVFHLILPSSRPRGESEVSTLSRRGSFLRAGWTNTVSRNPTTGLVPLVGFRRRSDVLGLLTARSGTVPVSPSSPFNRRSSALPGARAPTSSAGAQAGGAGHTTPATGTSRPRANTAMPRRRSSLLTSLGRGMVGALSGGMSRAMLLTTFDESTLPGSLEEEEDDDDDGDTGSREAQQQQGSPGISPTQPLAAAGDAAGTQEAKMQGEMLSPRLTLDSIRESDDEFPPSEFSLRTTDETDRVPLDEPEAI